MGRLAIDHDLAFGDQLLHVATRADAGLSQHLVQLGCVRFGSKHSPLRIGGDRAIGGLSVVVA